MKNRKYNVNEEYQVGLTLPEVQKQINEAKKLYVNFYKKFSRKFDLSKPDSIKSIYEMAKKEGIFKKAEGIRNLIFGKDIYFYGVSYLWDGCVNHCKYCPGSVLNRKKALREGKNYPLRHLSVEQATVFPRDFKKTIKEMKQRGYNPIF